MKAGFLATCCGSAALIYSAPAFAEELSNLNAQASITAENAADRIDDGNIIIVTAQKRSENLQDVPVAISALGNDALERAGVHDVSDISGAVPNAQAAAALGITSVFLRGIGTSALGVGADPSVAYHADGVYVARARAQTTGFFDVQRLEVVRGPQGDLYGRNATGGSLNVITRKPTDYFSGDFSGSYGNYNAVQLEGALSGPLIQDVLNARVAGYYNRHDGYGINIGTGNEIDAADEYGGRITLQFDPSPALSIEMIGEYFKTSDSIGAWHYLAQGRPDVPLTAQIFGGITPPDPRDIGSTVDPKRNQEAYALTGTAGLEISDDVSLKSITGFRDLKHSQLTDLSGATVLGATLTQSESQDQFSQELQLLASGDRWNLILGGYYFTESIVGDVTIPLFFFPGAIFRQEGTAKTNAFAAFGHADYEILDGLKLIGGLRYSHERKRSVGTFTAPANPIPTGGDVTFNAFTPKFAIEYKPNSDLLVYASVSRGFKSGGFIAGSPGPATNPEFVWSYEIGLKASALDNQLQANLAAFYYDYTDLVVTRVVGASVVNENAASATNKGFEAEIIMRPSNNFQVNASFGYLDAKYSEYDTADPTFLEFGVQNLAGKRLNNAPEFTARVGAEYNMRLGAGELIASADIKFLSEIFFSPFNAENLRQESYSIINARLSYQLDNGLKITAFGRNLANKLVVQSAIISADFLGFPVLGGLNEPRTYGLELGFKF